MTPNNIEEAMPKALCLLSRFFSIQIGRSLPRWRWPLLALLCLLTTACSSTAFIYNRLDFLVPWYVDDYVELNRAQEDQLDALLVTFLAWHRREELPRYIDLLDAAEAALDNALTLSELQLLMAEVEVAGDRLQRHMMDWVLPLGESLSDEQVAELIDNLHESQADYAEEYLERDEDEYLEDGIDGMEERCEEYLGRLSREQRVMIAEGMAQRYRFDSLWLDERAAWIERLSVILAREPGWQARVRDSLEQRWELASPDYQRVYEHNAGVIQALTVAVINSRSERQDRHLRDKLDDLRSDVRKLIEQGE